MLFCSRQFIRERIRYLVEAFSNRTNVVRRRLELPPTPSSLSSLDEVEPPPLSSRQISKSSFTNNGITSDGPDADKPLNCIGRLAKLYREKVLDPQSNFCMAWLFIVALAYMYNCWTIPLRSTFPYQTPGNRPVWMFFDYVSDLVYIIDIALIQPRIMYISDGFWVTDVKQTRRCYMQSTYFKVNFRS